MSSTATLASRCGQSAEIQQIREFFASGDFVRLIFVAWNKWAPRLGSNWFLCFPDNAELAVGPHFSDHHRLVEMVVSIHFQDEATRRFERLADHCIAHFIY